MAIEFVVQSEELRQALKFVLPSSVLGRAQAEFIDINMCGTEVTFVSADRSSSIPAEVIIPGNARAPVWVLEWFRKAVNSLNLPSVRISIVEGQLRAERLTYSHPEITTSVISVSDAVSTGTKDGP